VCTKAILRGHGATALTGYAELMMMAAFDVTDHIIIFKCYLNIFGFIFFFIFASISDLLLWAVFVHRNSEHLDNIATLLIG